MKTYFVKDSYNANLQNAYYDDAPDDGIIWQPDVYRHAVEYAKTHNIKHIVDIGSGNGEKLEAYKNDFNITFIDFGANLDTIHDKFKDSNKAHSYIDQNFEDSFPALDSKVIKNAVVICSDVIEHIRIMENLTKALVEYSKTARLLLISTPDREKMYGYDQDGQPLNPCHVREWRLEELRLYLKSEGMKFTIGLTRTNDRARQRATIFVIAGRDMSVPHENAARVYESDGYLHKVVPIKNIDTAVGKIKFLGKAHKSSVLGLINPIDDDYILRHMLRALKTDASFSVSHFKFINEDAQNKCLSGGIENTDRVLLQYVETTHHKGLKDTPYPIQFSMVHDYTFGAHSHELRLTLAFEMFKQSYVPELFFGFAAMTQETETLTLLPDQKALNNDLHSLRAQVAQLSYDHDETKRILELRDRELRRIYRNPAYYVYRGGRKAASKLRRRIQ